jgi:hypothetical protein
MFHDERTWCVRPEGTPEDVALQVTRRTWPACTAFAIRGYLILNDSLPEEGSIDYAVVKRPAERCGSFVQIASLTLGFFNYEDALDRLRRVLAGDYDALASAYAVEPRLETAREHIARRCPFCS